MNSNHLSAWEQEEYVIEQRTPGMLRHLTECAQCRKAVEELEHSLTSFRSAAMQLGSQSLAERPQREFVVSTRQLPPFRWAFAALIPLLLLVLVLLPFHPSNPSRPPARAHMSDDALLDQVDEQVSVAVPSSMESLTHLVSTGSESRGDTSAPGSKRLVQDN
jgi:hypothetical protein